jgi:glycosyltransferase involved in cell wall biosynthesis
MRILYLAGREMSYPRNDVLARALGRLGVHLEIVGHDQPGPLFQRSLQIALRALPRLAAQRYDLIFVGFYGHLLMLLVGQLSRIPIVFDAFLSTYDTLCFDRRICAPNSASGRLAFWLDQTTSRRADRVLLDTDLHADYFHATFGTLRERLCALPVGCNESLFYPRPMAKRDNTTHVLFYTTYLPLHGVDTVIRAAAQLRGERDLRFTLLGAGPGLAEARRLTDNQQAYNVTFAPPVPIKTLPDYIAVADIVLGGHFGTSAKANRVIPGKLYQILALGRPLIAGDTPANRTLLAEGIQARLCNPADPDALATILLQLHRDPEQRARLGAAGRALYLQRCSEAVITEQLRTLIAEVAS